MYSEEELELWYKNQKIKLEKEIETFKESDRIFLKEKALKELEKLYRKKLSYIKWRETPGNLESSRKRSKKYRKSHLWSNEEIKPPTVNEKLKKLQKASNVLKTKIFLNSDKKIPGKNILKE